MELHTIGIDLGKTVFHLIALNRSGESVVRKKFLRNQLLRFTANVQVYLMLRADGGQFGSNPKIGVTSEFSWVCDPPICMKIVASRSGYDSTGVGRRRPSLLWISRSRVRVWSGSRVWTNLCCAIHPGRDGLVARDGV